MNVTSLNNYRLENNQDYTDEQIAEAWGDEGSADTVAERGRVNEILAHGGTSKRKFAEHCAFNTNASVEQAKAYIDAAASEDN